MPERLITWLVLLAFLAVSMAFVLLPIVNVRYTFVWIVIAVIFGFFAVNDWLAAKKRLELIEKEHGSLTSHIYAIMYLEKDFNAAKQFLVFSLVLFTVSALRILVYFCW